MTMEENNTLSETVASALEAFQNALDEVAGAELQTDESQVSSQEEKLEPISRTFFMSETTSRFSSAVWYEKVKEKDVLIAGLGGIGSYVCYLMSRLKPAKITIYDPDFVEPANMSGQLYCKENMDQSKVVSMVEMMHSYSDYYNITGLSSRYNYDSLTKDIMICGFDNMNARKLFFSKWREHLSYKSPEERKHCLYLDGRLAAEEFQVLCIKGDDDYNIRRYEKEWLFDDHEAEATVCSYKQTTFMANMIGSVMINLFVNFCANDVEGEEHPAFERDLPFLTTYDAQMMMFHTEA